MLPPRAPLPGMGTPLAWCHGWRKDNDESETQDSTSTSEEEKDLGKEETAKLEESSHLDSCEGAEETCVASADSRLSTSEQLDYFIKYIAIVSYKQHQSYKDDFNAEYDEYRNLHARMESISRRFMELDAQQKLLTPWSKEYQMLHEEVLEEYQKIKQSNPNYYEETGWKRIQLTPASHSEGRQSQEWAH